MAPQRIKPVSLCFALCQAALLLLAASATAAMPAAMAGARGAPVVARIVITPGVMPGLAGMVPCVVLAGSAHLGFIRLAGTDHGTELDAQAVRNLAPATTELTLGQHPCKAGGRCLDWLVI